MLGLIPRCSRRLCITQVIGSNKVVPLFDEPDENMKEESQPSREGRYTSQIASCAVSWLLMGAIQTHPRARSLKIAGQPG